MFPYLKIDFFTETIEQNICEGELFFTDETSIAELIEAIKNHFGLHTQIFRKFDNLWINTSFTTQWSLSQQNNTGQEISKIYSEGKQISVMTAILG